ncbi:MAG: hypothetical protein V9E99_08270 [Microthrixaceae bacterium]|nr:hypothetical protein [Microthrixaceae bacterium]HMS15018.1 hypothetical protein [Microthrixaceae bacterium]HMT25720.1 hypothetical protein [Microthrixaceae bacterium]HMT60085.1 hypothetical protein [Microthrixaceae bacterium]
MAMSGYIANVLQVPPLVFRFQMNPTVLSEKRSFEYKDQPAAAVTPVPTAKPDEKPSMLGAVTGFLGGAYEGAKKLGPKLTATTPVSAGPQAGKPRVIELEFPLDANWTEPDGSYRWGSPRIDLDLQILRSFVNPGLAITDVLDALGGVFLDKWKPPELSLRYGGVSLTGVMTDLNIKVVSFFDDGSPLRAEINAVIKEQTYSIAAVTGTIGRLLDTGNAALRTPIGDIAAASPIGGLFD